MLVAVINNPRDLKIAREQRWYRIPLARAPSQVGADYLAFYQTKAFCEERWAVNYYAPIRRFHIFPRRDLLPEEPNHPRAGELYYKIEIGALQPLPRRIPSHRLRRLTFISTTLERLLTAEEINDLWCGSAVEERLWRAFKENGVAAERYYPLTEDPESQRVNFAILCRGGKIAVVCESGAGAQTGLVLREQARDDENQYAAGGWTMLRLRAYETTRSLGECVGTVVTEVARHGGVVSPDR